MRGVPTNGEVIKQLRRSQGLTQETLADRADCDARTVRNAERSRHVDLSTVERIAVVLGVEHGELVDSLGVGQERENVKLVMKYHEAFNGRDPDAMADLFHDDGKVAVVSDVPLPGGGEFVGKQGVLMWAKTCMEAYRTQEITADMMEIDAVRDLVFVRGKTDRQVTSVQTGKSARASAMLEFRVREGKIASLRIVTNTAVFERILREAEPEDDE